MLSQYEKKYRTFLKRLRTARKEASLSQEAVAARLEKPQSFVSKCETGERRVDVIELLAFAKIYQKPLGYFLDFHNTEEPSK